MKFLVLGASGMAGHTICRYLLRQGHDVTGFSRRSLDFIPCIKGDVSNEHQLRTVIQSSAVDVVVNAIGILNADAERYKSTAVYLNAFLPHQLAAITADSSTRIVHMSTDCVFEGNTGPYTEASLPDGKSFYDRSKALGELDDGKNVTLRNSIVGPDVNLKGIGLLNWFLKQSGSVTGFRNALWTGMTTLELAKAIEAVSEDGTTGLVNMVPAGNISKYELLRLFNEHFRNGSLTIVPVSEPHLDKTLQRTNFESAFLPATYEQQIVELAEWVRCSPGLYPHYRMD